MVGRDILYSKGFSNNVYGEVGTEFVKEMIAVCGIKGDSVFVDLGSGTGIIRRNRYSQSFQTNNQEMSYYRLLPQLFVKLME
jgi:adenine-specific DNA methylase